MCIRDRVTIWHLVLDKRTFGKKVPKATAHELAAAGVDIENNIHDFGADALVVGQVGDPIHKFVGSAVLRTGDKEADGVRGEQKALATGPCELFVHAVQSVEKKRRVRTPEADVLYGDDLQSLPEQPFGLGSVSYTHLDVYKRQAIVSENGSPAHG